MQQIFYFFQKYKYFLFFLLLEFVAVILIINNNTFHKSKFLSSTGNITGFFYKNQSSISDYLNLEEQNLELSKENEYLKNQIEKYKFLSDSLVVSSVNDTLQYHQKYVFIKTKIIKNSYNTSLNYVTIDRGKNHKVDKEMAVINSKGIIGITDKVSSKYARVQSILNINSKINAGFKNNSHYGSLTWNGKDYNTVQLTDIPRQAIFNIGDTIVTGGKSTIFPEGIPIGTILNKPELVSTATNIDIKLFNDMSNVKNAYVIISLDKKEVESLENNTTDE